MILVGIDTGVHTGVAIWNTREKKFEKIYTTKIAKAMEDVLILHNTTAEIKIFVEDARKRKWFQSSAKSRDEERKMLQGVGSVKRDAQIWEEFLTDKCIDFEMVHPKDNRTKLSAQLFAKYTKYEARTSEHSRDAAMLVFGKPSTKTIFK